MVIALALAPLFPTKLGKLICPYLLLSDDAHQWNKLLNDSTGAVIGVYADGSPISSNAIAELCCTT